MRGLDDVRVGDEIPEQTETLTQATLLRYAGASGDYNPLHWDPEFAAGASPTGTVLAHGMLNAGILCRVVTEWAGGPERLRSMTSVFRRPCPVDATVAYGGEVVDVDADDVTATLAVWARLPDGATLIDGRRSRAVVRLDRP